MERIVWIIVVVALLGALLGGGLGSQCDADSNEHDYIELFIDAFNEVKRSYVSEVDSKTIMYGAIEGMLKSLGDDHTYFMDEEKYQDMQIQIKGKFYGIGVEISLRNDVLTVVSPIEGTPADKAGMKANDKILKINQESTEGMTIMDAVHKIRGERMTPVVLTIVRDSVEEPFDIEILRDEIQITSVKSMILDQKIGYVNLKTFSMESSHDLEVVLKDFMKKSVKGIVFDLRGNPGGLLNGATKVSDFFIDDGILVSTKGRSSYESQEYKASKEFTLVAKEIPVVLLINEGSASASEIVAGALQDHKRALLVGTKSFGKASVQKFFPMQDREIALRLTVAKYYTPSGRLIHGNGIEPDVNIERDIFKKEDEKNLLKMTKQKSMSRFLKQQKAKRYSEDLAKKFIAFLIQNKTEIDSKTARYLLKRELNLKTPIVDQEFDNQLGRALEIVKQKM